MVTPQMANHVRSLAPNQLVSAGTEGEQSGRAHHAGSLTACAVMRARCRLESMLEASSKMCVMAAADGAWK